MILELLHLRKGIATDPIHLNFLRREPMAKPRRKALLFLKLLSIVLKLFLFIFLLLQVRREAPTRQGLEMIQVLDKDNIPYEHAPTRPWELKPPVPGFI